MAETSADAPPPPPPPPPPKSNKEKKKEWCAAIEKGKRQRKKARRARIEAMFNAMLDHYNAMVRVSWSTTWGISREVQADIISRATRTSLMLAVTRFVF